MIKDSTGTTLEHKHKKLTFSIPTYLIELFELKYSALYLFLKVKEIFNL